MAAAQAKIVFVHGWGFHGGVWAHLAPHFGSYDVSYWGGDFVGGGPALARTIPEGAIVIGHSFGVAQVLAARPQDMRALVSICGFDSLAARGRERAICDLLKGLARNEVAQMRAFWANCGAGGFAGLEGLDRRALVGGLQDMLGLDARLALESLSCPVLALASTDDKVIPFGVSSAVWEHRELVVSETGGHGLPITRPAWCAQHIQRFLHEHVG